MIVKGIAQHYQYQYEQKQIMFVLQYKKKNYVILKKDYLGQDLVVRKRQVQQDQVKIFSQRCCQAGHPGLALDNVESGLPQETIQQQPQVRFVLNHQDARHSYPLVCRSGPEAPQGDLRS